MVAGDRGLHGQPVQRPAEGGTKVVPVSATALNLNTVARNVLEKRSTETAVTRMTALLVSISHSALWF